MKRLILIAAVLAALSLLLGGCSGAGQTAATPAPTPSAAPTLQPTASAQPKKTYFEHMDFDSKAIAQNLVKEKTVQQLFVLLPPSYYDSDRRYPVVYYFSGFTQSPGTFLPNYKDVITKSMEQTGYEFIAVEVDGVNQFGGSFLVNSPVTGNWEDYVTDEVVPFIDGKYRTKPDAGSRGVAGFSMGGFAALNLAMRNPDVFCATYAICPGVLEDDNLKEALDSWDPGFLSAYGKAFCPMPDIPDKLTVIPELDGTGADNAIVQKWLSGFANLQGKIDAYLALGKPLKAITIEYGTTDGYKWIPKGCVAFSKLLNEKGIAHELKSFEGGHTIPMDFAKSTMAEFFGKAFARQP